jgi:hypothetical protein
MKMSEKKSVEVIRPVVPMDNRGVSLTTMDDAWAFCKALETSGVAPKGMKQAAIFAVVQAGAELGLSPMRALSNMKVINGRVGPMGSLAKALVRKAAILAPGTGFKENYSGEEGSDDWTAHFSTLRDGESEAYHTTFSVKDAKRAALWGKGGPWSQYPKRMLMWRAVGFHMDDYYSDVLMGFHIAEVLDDYPEERVAVTMSRLDEPSKDPLLDELEEIAETMRPKTTCVGMGNDPIEGPDEIPVEGNVDLKTGEYLDDETTGVEDKGPVGQAKPSTSPLSAVMAEKAAEEPPMTEEEAMRDLIREGIVREEDLEPVNPDNKAAEGADQEDLF